MRSTFTGLVAGQRGMAAAQDALDLVAHNVANANTAGYSRRVAAAALSDAGAIAGGTGVGVGANALAAVRYRNVYLDRQYRVLTGQQGYAQQQSQGLEQLERVLGPGGSVLQDEFEEFWAAVQDLSNRPGDPEMRVQMRERVESLLDRFQSVYSQLESLREGLNVTLTDRIAEANQLSLQVADLNQQLIAATPNSLAEGDLQDRRDLLLDRLSTLTGSVTAEVDQRQVGVFLGGTALVYGAQSYAMGTQLAADGQATATHPLTGDPLAFPAGELRALAELKDVDIPQILTQLDDLVRSLATRFNAVHQTGYGLDGSTGLDLFTIGAGPLEVSLNPVIAADLDRLAAAGSPAPPAGVVAPSDGENARRMGDIRTEALLPPPSGGAAVTADAYFRSLVGQWGVRGQAARRRAELADLQVQQAQKQRESFSGVSLDEEMTQMIAQQQAYTAAARVITAIDEALTTVISRMGIVGR